MTYELLIQQAKVAKSPAELLALAKEHAVPMDEESAAAYFAQLNKRGELADEELDSVSGGACYKDGRKVVTVGHKCDNWLCEDCHMVCSHYDDAIRDYRKCTVTKKQKVVGCNNCQYMSYEGGLWLCNNPKEMR